MRPAMMWICCISFRTVIEVARFVSWTLRSEAEEEGRFRLARWMMAADMTEWVLMKNMRRAE